MPGLKQLGGTSQTRRAGPNDGDFPAGRFRGDAQFGPAVLVRLFGKKSLNIRNRQGTVADEALQTVALALLLDGTQPRTDLWKDVGLADDLIGLAFFAVEEQADELRDLDVGGTTDLARRLLALAARRGQTQQVVSVASAAVLEDRAVDPVVPHDTAGPAAVPHDLGAGAASDADLLPMHPPVLHDVPREIRVGKSHAAGPDQCHETVGLVGGADVGEERPQPAIAGADEGHIREFLLKLAGDVDESCHARQWMLRLVVSADDGFIERPAHVRIVVRIRHGNVDELDAALPQQADESLGLGQVRLGVIAFVHAPAIGIGNGIVDAQARHDAGFIAELCTDFIDHFQEESRPVLERAAVLAGALVAGQQLVDEIAVARLDVHCVETDFERNTCRLDIGILKFVKIVIRDKGPVVGDFALPIGIRPWLWRHRVAVGVALWNDRPGCRARLAVSARVSQLCDDNGPVTGSIGLGGFLACPLDESGEGLFAALVQP